MFTLLLDKLFTKAVLAYDLNKLFIQSSLNFKVIRQLSSGVSKMSVFEGRNDRFNGITVVSVDEPCDGSTFKDTLERSLQIWTDMKKNAIWFRVHLTESNWVPILANNGFQYHHAHTDYVMMYKWLPKDLDSHIPPFAHTLIGVGAVVINENNEVLIVKEKHFLTPHWKLPGGYVEPGENFVDAAIREVYEETNIQTEFSNVLSLRHGHGGQFRCSDLYIVVCLKALSLEITKCEREISYAQWIDINEYLKHPDIHELNKFFVKKYLDNKNDDIKIECTHGIHQILKKPFTMYHALLNKGNKL